MSRKGGTRVGVCSNYLFTMKVIDALKLNKFKQVSVPRNKDLYARVGGRIPSLGTTGFVSEYGKNKMDVLSDADAAISAEFEEASQAQ